MKKLNGMPYYFSKIGGTILNLVAEYELTYFFLFQDKVGELDDLNVRDYLGRCFEIDLDDVSNEYIFSWIFRKRNKLEAELNGLNNDLKKFRNSENLREKVLEVLDISDNLYRYLISENVFSFLDGNYYFRNLQLLELYGDDFMYMVQRLGYKKD